MSNRRKGKEPQMQEADDRERDATMAPTVTKPIFHYLSDDDLEDYPITKKLRTFGSFHINDCNPMIKNVPDATVDSRDLVHETILEEARNEEPIITNEERIEDRTLQLTANSGGQMITCTKREKLFSKRLTKYDLHRCFGGGLKLPLKLVTDNILVHVSAPADGEGKPLTLVDHEGEKWDMLFVLKSNKYYLRGKWYEYVEKYELKDSDTIIIEKITVSKEQVKEVVGFDAVNQIGDPDWDTICKDQQIEVAYEITIERVSGNTATEQEDDENGDEE